MTISEITKKLPTITVAELTQILSTLTIREIALLILADWKAKSKTGINFGAKPYLDAMFTMSHVNDNFGMDSGKSIILYFLSNATTWKGDVAKTIKTELKKRVKA